MYKIILLKNALHFRVYCDVIDVIDTSNIIYLKVSNIYRYILILRIRQFDNLLSLKFIMTFT